MARPHKWLWGLADGDAVETVLMHYPGRSTVCVSSQAGCAMACGFCATGQEGFRRHLTTGEIVEQVIRAREAAKPRRLSNVVFMGMGEPLANYDAVWGAVRRIHGDLGSRRGHITMSTVGVVPGIRRMAEESLPVSLAVSLHASTDELRNELVPLNKQYPIDVLAEACAGYVAASGRRLSFEWALIDGVNDTREQATHLAELCRELRAHVNLIPLNPTPGYPTIGHTAGRRGPVPAVASGRGHERHDSPQPRYRHRRRLRAASGQSDEGRRAIGGGTASTFRSLTTAVPEPGADRATLEGPWQIATHFRVRSPVAETRGSVLVPWTSPPRSPSPQWRRSASS